MFFFFSFYGYSHHEKYISFKSPEMSAYSENKTYHITKAKRWNCPTMTSFPLSDCSYCSFQTDCTSKYIHVGEHENTVYLALRPSSQGMSTDTWQCLSANRRFRQLSISIFLSSKGCMSVPDEAFTSNNIGVFIIMWLKSPWLFSFNHNWSRKWWQSGPSSHPEPSQRKQR